MEIYVTCEVCYLTVCLIFNRIYHMKQFLAKHIEIDGLTSWNKIYVNYTPQKEILYYIQSFLTKIGTNIMQCSYIWRNYVFIGPVNF